MIFRPSIKFSLDEAIACRLATNEVQFFDPEDFSKGIVHRLRVPGVAAVELSKTPGAYVAAFVPESKVLNPLLRIDSWKHAVRNGISGYLFDIAGEIASVVQYSIDI